MLLLKPHLLLFTSISGSRSQQLLLLWCVVDKDFYFPHSFYVYSLERLCKEEQPFLPQLFPRVVWTQRYVFYSVGCRAILNSFSLVKPPQRRPPDAPSGWCSAPSTAPSLLTRLPYFLPHEMALGPSSCIFPVPALASIASPSGPGSFYWRMVFRNQDLNAKGVDCYWE